MPGFLRRSFLKITTQGLLTISDCLAWVDCRFLSYEPEPPPRVRYEVGDAKNFP